MLNLWIAGGCALIALAFLARAMWLIEMRGVRFPNQQVEVTLLLEACALFLFYVAFSYFFF